MSVVGCIYSGKYLSGICLVGEMSVGDMSGRGCVWSGKCPSGMCLVGEVSVGDVSGRGNVCRGSVRRERVRRRNVRRGCVRESMKHLRKVKNEKPWGALLGKTSCYLLILRKSKSLIDSGNIRKFSFLKHEKSFFLRKYKKFLQSGSF